MGQWVSNSPSITQQVVFCFSSGPFLGWSFPSSCIPPFPFPHRVVLSRVLERSVAFVRALAWIVLFPAREGWVISFGVCSVLLVSRPLPLSFLYNPPEDLHHFKVFSNSRILRSAFSVHVSLQNSSPSRASSDSPFSSLMVLCAGAPRGTPSPFFGAGYVSFPLF